MIKVILLKDAEEGKSSVFAKAIIENNGFSIEIAVGNIKKDKSIVLPKGTVVFDLPDAYIGKLTTKTESFVVESTGEIKQVTNIVIN